MMRTATYLFFITVVSFLLVGCNIKDNKTTIEIVDNNRHYYPILVEQKLDIMFEVKNTGDAPFILDDIITSCGCIMVKKSSINQIPKGKTGRLMMQYDSRKNIGYVKHYITLYGNFTTTDKIEIMFDVNVVPNNLYTKDYEELYREKIEKEGGVKTFVDGDESRKGYYLTTDKDIVIE